MNIGSMIRGLLGESKPAEVKALEMKPGQVVRGLIINVSEDGQEATVQIQGVHVKAKLEASLRPGETALLQVQPPGEDGAVILKPVTQGQGTVMSGSSLADMLKSSGLPDSPEIREIVKGIQNAGVPLTKENISVFKEVLAMKPLQIPAGEWAESAAIAFQRGLPVSLQSVKGLHQAVFGPPLHQLLQTLEHQLDVTVQIQNQRGAGTAAGDGVGAAGIASAADGRYSTQGLPQNPSAAQAGGQAVVSTAAGNTADGAAGMPGTSGAQADVPEAELHAALRSGTAAAPAGPPPAAALLAKLQGLMHQLRNELAQPWAGGTAQPAQGPPSHEAEPWVGRVLKLLGAEHEQQALRGSGAGAPAAAGASAAAGAGPAAGANAA
ncbi:flagellar hook-length control protein FliK, partial [Paenibacillus lemnae]|nr:flagellar hook-length control protein FliK [Paenibacillus lemnae]